MPIEQKELVDCVKKYDPSVDEDFLTRAYIFSQQAHAQQKRASGDPYFTHPLEVAYILARLKLDVSTIVAALLHDTVEDTLATLEEIERLFGKEVAFLVDGVTKLSHIEIPSSQGKQSEKIRKLLIAMSADIRVLLVKLADRLHNMQTLKYVSSGEKRQRIARETMNIYVPLAERIGLREIKETLEDLAFAELNPDAHSSIVLRLGFLRSAQNDLVTPILDEIRQLFLKNNLSVVVSGREKQPYSIWEKMQRKNISFEQLSDIIAFRVVVEAVPQCYEALGILHRAYAVIPGKFKDYISTPKQNNYQGLHTTMIGPFQHRIEIQIHTQEMMKIAEYGVAAHWQYKQGTSHDTQQYKWLRDLLEILENASNPEEFFEHTRLEIFQDQVFCFTPKGDVINLPRGATPIDFAYAVHSEIGNSCVGARINGQMMPLRTVLENGDQVQILTSKSQTPSPTWERFVITSKARASVRRFIRNRQREQFAQLGKSILQKVCLENHRVFSEKLFEKYVLDFDCDTLEDFYTSIGEGLLTGAEILTHVLVQEEPHRHSLKEKIESSKTRYKKTDFSVSIEGLIPGMAVHYAPCCHPLPGDSIVGVITAGNGVHIHTQDCEDLCQVGQDRFLDVSWTASQGAGEKYSGRLSLVMVNQTGGLAALANIFAKEKANILNIKITSRTIEHWELLVDLELNDRQHLNEVIASLRMSSWVLFVDRL